MTDQAVDRLTARMHDLQHDVSQVSQSLDAALVRLKRLELRVGALADDVQDQLDRLARRAP